MVQIRASAVIDSTCALQITASAGWGLAADAKLTDLCPPGRAMQLAPGRDEL